MAWWRDFAATLQSFGTIVFAVFGGAWAFWKFGLGQERYPHIETSADVVFIGQHGAYWIVELIAYVENKGKAQHRMAKFDFDLSSIEKQDDLIDAEEFGGQVLFPHPVKAGSFLGDFDYFVIDGGVKSKYSYVTKVPKSSEFLIFHYWFEYGDKRKFSHAAEKTVAVPSSTIQA